MMTWSVELIGDLHCDNLEDKISPTKKSIEFSKLSSFNVEDGVIELSDDDVDGIIKVQVNARKDFDFIMDLYLNLNINYSFLHYAIDDVIDPSWSNNEKMLFLRYIDNMFLGGTQSREEYLIMYFNLLKSGLSDNFLRFSPLYNYYKTGFKTNINKVFRNVSISFLFENVTSFLKSCEPSMEIHKNFIDYIFSLDDIFKKEEFLKIFLDYLSTSDVLIEYFLLKLSNNFIIDVVFPSLCDQLDIFNKYNLVLAKLLKSGDVEFSFLEVVTFNDVNNSICNVFGNVDVIDDEYCVNILDDISLISMSNYLENLNDVDFVKVLKFAVKFHTNLNKYTYILVEKLKDIVDKMIECDVFVSELDFKIIVEFLFLHSSKFDGLSTYILKLSEFYSDNLPSVVCLKHRYVAPHGLEYFDMKKNFERNLSRPGFLKNLDTFELIELMGLAIKYKVKSSFLLDPVFQIALSRLSSLTKIEYVQVIRYLLKLRIFFSNKMIKGLMLNISDFEKRGVLELLWTNVLLTSYSKESSVIYKIIEGKISDLPSTYDELFNLLLPLKRLRVKNLTVVKAIIDKIIQTFMVDDVLLINDDNLINASHFVFRLTQVSKRYPGEFNDELNSFFDCIDQLILKGVDLKPFAKVDYVYAMMIVQRVNRSILDKLLPFTESDIRLNDRFSISMAWRASRYFNYALLEKFDRLFWSYSLNNITYENISEQRLFEMIKGRFPNLISSITLNVFDKSSLGYEMDILIVSKNGVRINVEFDGVGHSGFLDASRDELLKRRNHGKSSIGAAYVLRVEKLTPGRNLNIFMEKLQESLIALK